MVKKTFEKKMKLNFLPNQYKKDSKLKRTHKNVFLRVVSLRDSWTKFLKK